MLEKVGIMHLAGQAAKHAALRQQASARNVANVDTPGYRAQDVSAFNAQLGDRLALRTTHALHIGGGGQDQAAWQMIDAGGEVDPNGNSVSVSEEVLRSVEAQRVHGRALTIYQTSLDILRVSIGKRG